MNQMYFLVKCNNWKINVMEPIDSGNMGFQICVISEGYLDQNDTYYEMVFMMVVMLVVVVVMLVKMVVFSFTKSAFVHCNLNISSPPIPAERI